MAKAKAKLTTDMKGGEITVKYCGLTLLTIDKSVLAKLTSKECELPSSVAAEHARVLRFARAYVNAKKDFFGKPVGTRKYTSSHKDFKYFVLAVKIMDEHNVKGPQYIQSQVDGLSFINDGRGIFPKPNQMASDGAEDRLIEFLDRRGEIDHGELGLTNGDTALRITDADKKTGLKDNAQYMKLLAKLRSGNTTMEEAMYLKKVRRVRKGSAGPEITEYIKNLKK